MINTITVIFTIIIIIFLYISIIIIRIIAISLNIIRIFSYQLWHTVVLACLQKVPSSTIRTKNIAQI